MAQQAESLGESSTHDAAEPALGLSRAAAIVLPMPRVTADGHPKIDHAAGGRLGPACGVIVGVIAGAALWAGLLSLAWRIVH